MNQLTGDKLERQKAVGGEVAAEVDEGAGTLKFIKIKNFIRSNSARVYTAPVLPGFSYLLRRQNSWDGAVHGSSGGGRGEGATGVCTLPWKRPKGIIIISGGLGLLKRKQTPLEGEATYYPHTENFIPRQARLLIFGWKFRIPLSLPDFPARPRSPNRNGK